MIVVEGYVAPGRVRQGQGTGTSIYIQIRNGEEGLLDIEEAAQKWGRGEPPDPVIDHRCFFLPHPSSPARRGSYFFENSPVPS